jgi:cyclic beta-1,2-glucan synthetase
MDIKRYFEVFRLRQAAAAFRRWRASRRKFEYEPALRSTLFSADQMEHHGTHLAGQHRLSTRASSVRLLSRLRENESILVTSCEMLTTAAHSTRRVTPAAEWLLADPHRTDARSQGL